MKVLFAGTPEFAAGHLEGLARAGANIIGVISQPDRSGKRGKKLIPTPVKQTAIELGLDVIQPERLRARDIEPFAPDVLVVVAYGQILRQDVLDLPTHGCINVHASLLPRWRGAAPIQRAILAGDAETGVCIMKMDAGLDTGDVYSTRSVTILPTDTTGTLSDKLLAAGVEALVKTLDDIGEGRASAKPQPDEGITYASKIDKDEAKINWQCSATEIDRAIRAYNPDPVAYTWLGELRLRIWEARPESGSGSPGEILAASKAGIEVACGDGSIMITRLQLPVGKGTVMTAADVLNARRNDFVVGAAFTSP